MTVDVDLIVPLGWTAAFALVLFGTVINWSTIGKTTRWFLPLIFSIAFLEWIRLFSRP